MAISLTGLVIGRDLLQLQPKELCSMKLFTTPVCFVIAIAGMLGVSVPAQAEKVWGQRPDGTKVQVKRAQRSPGVFAAA